MILTSTFSTRLRVGLELVSPLPVLVGAEQNCRKNDCAPQRAPEERNGCDVAMHQPIPSWRIGMPCCPNAEIADQIKGGRACQICRHKPAQADASAQQPSC